MCRVPPYLVFLCMSCSMLCVFWRGWDCDMVSGGWVMAFRTLTLSHHKLTKRSHVKHEENISLALCTKRIITYCSWTQFNILGSDFVLVSILHRVQNWEKRCNNIESDVLVTFWSVPSRTNIQRAVLLSIQHHCAKGML